MILLPSNSLGDKITNKLSDADRECLEDLMVRDVEVPLSRLMEGIEFQRVPYASLNDTDSFFMNERMAMTKPKPQFPSEELIAYESTDGNFLVLVHRLERLTPYLNTVPRFRTFIMQCRFSFEDIPGIERERTSRMLPSEGSLDGLNRTLHAVVEKNLSVYSGRSLRNTDGYSQPEMFIGKREVQMDSSVSGLPVGLRAEQFYFSAICSLALNGDSVEQNKKASSAEAVAKGIAASINLTNLYLRGELGAYMSQITARNDILSEEQLIGAAFLPFRN